MVRFLFFLFRFVARLKMKKKKKKKGKERDREKKRNCITFCSYKVKYGFERITIIDQFSLLKAYTHVQYTASFF